MCWSIYPKMNRVYKMLLNEISAFSPLFLSLWVKKMLTIKRMYTKIKKHYYQQIDVRLFIQVNFLLIENFIHFYALPF